LADLLWRDRGKKRGGETVARGVPECIDWRTDLKRDPLPKRMFHGGVECVRRKERGRESFIDRPRVDRFRAFSTHSMSTQEIQKFLIKERREEKK